MSGLSIHAKRQLAEQLAREQLNKSGQYRFGIPQSVLNAKANEFMRLSDKELQQKFNEYFQSTGLNAKPKDLWDSMGLNLEQKKKAQANMKSLQAQVNKKYMRPTSAKTKNVGANQAAKPLPKDVKKEIRQFMATLLQQTYSQKVEEFRNYLLNNKTSFAELGMELHDLGAKVADGLTSAGIVVDRSDTRAEIREKLIDKQAKAGVLANCVDDEEMFNKLFKEYFNEDFDYQTTFDYICATNDFATTDSSNKVEKFNKKLNNITKYTIKSADDYMKNANGAGGLLDLAFNVALMCVSGGSSAIAKYAQMTAKGGTELAGKVITNVAGKKVAQSATGQTISQGVGIVAAQTTSAGLNAVAFQGTKVADLAGETLATGEFNTDKAENIVASAEGLFKFGYVGGAISGPLGMQVKNMTTKLLNSKPIINQILTKGITNKPTPLTTVLKDISEHSEAVGEVLKFGTEFGINAGYMAYDEGISYTDAMANLAQMDGVSKMVLAMLGAKNMSFLTPEKVQQIKTDLAGYKVNITAFKGQKVYSVKDAQGKETVLATPEELFMFILDKEAKVAGVKTETKVETKTASAKDVKATETTGKKPYVKPELTDIENVLPKEVNNRIENFNSLDKKLIEKALDRNFELTNSLLSIKDKDGNYIFTAQDVEWFTDSKGVDLYSALKDVYGEERLKYYKEKIDALIKENPNAETIIKVLSDIDIKYPNGTKEPAVPIEGLEDLVKFVTPNNIEKVVQNLKSCKKSLDRWQVKDFVKDILEQSMVECEKKFSPTERVVIKEEITKHPEKQEAFEKMLQNPDVSEKQVIEILKSEKISIKDLKNIDLHIKTAKEQGFDLINLLESKEEDFNNYINTESERIKRNIPAQRTPNGFKITDNPKELAKQLKFIKDVSSSTFEEISKLSKEETKTISQIFASEDALKKLNYDNLGFIIKNYKNAKPEDINLIQQGIEAGVCVYGDNKVKLFLDAAGNNASKREVVSMLFKNIAEYEKIVSKYNYPGNLFTQNSAMLKILNDINTPEQVEALKYYFEHTQLEKMNVSYGYIPDFTKVKTVNDVKDILKLQNYNCSYEFKNLYMSLSAEDRVLFTKEQFDNASRFGQSGYQYYIDIIKTLLDPKLDEVTKNDIREFLKTNPSENKQYEWDKCFENIDGVRTLIPETLRRFTALDKTGVKYDQNEYEHFAYIKNIKDGKIEYLYSTKDLNKRIEILNNPNIKEKLGRMLTMREACDISNIKHDWQLDFVIENLAKDMKESDIVKLCWETMPAKMPEQLSLVKLALKYDHKFPTKDSEIVMWDNAIYECLTTKESIEAFEKIFERNDYTTNEAYFLKKMAATSDGNTFAVKYELVNKTGKLKSNINNDYYEHFIEYTENEFQAKFLEEAGAFLEKHPEFKEHFEAIEPYNGNSSFYKNINSKEVLTTILNNLKKIEKSDSKYISGIFKPNRLFMNSKTFADLLLSNFSYEKIDFIKSLKIKDGWNKDSLSQILCSDADIETLKLIINKSEEIYEIETTAEYINDKNVKLAKLLLNDKNIKLEDLREIIEYRFSRCTKEGYDAKIEFYNTFKDNTSDFESFIRILRTVNEVSKDFAIKLYSDKEFPKEHIADIVRYTNKDNIAFAEKLCADKEFSKEHVADILWATNKDNIAFAEKLCADKEFPKEHIAKIVEYTNKDNIAFAEKLCADKEFPKEHIADILRFTNQDNVVLANNLYENKEIPSESIADILKYADKRNIKDVTNFCTKYKEYGIKANEIANLIPVLNDIKLENIQILRDKIGENAYQKLSANDLVILTNNIEIVGKSNINDLLKSERYNFINLLLSNKNRICHGNSSNIKEIAPIFPTNNVEYVTRMKELADSLNISIEQLSPEKQKRFNQGVKTLCDNMQEINLSELTEINLKYSQKEFINDINNLLKNLPEEEQIKLQSKWGFRIVDGKLTGYPKAIDDIASIEYQNKELVNKINKTVSNFLNNNAITVKDNPSLNGLLNNLFEICPEILNQIDGTPNFTNVIKNLQKITNNKNFKTLSSSDKKILVLATLVENGNKIVNTSKDAAFDAYFIGKKYGLTDPEAIKLYYIVEAGNSIEIFMQTTKDFTERNYRSQVITGQDRQDKFDLMALNLKEDNRFQLAQMLYSSKYPSGFTRNFDKALENRINEIKSQDFILPQTPSEDYLQHSTLTEIKRDNNSYNVNVVNAKDIPNLYALIHTPEAGFATGGTRGANFANFEAFSTLNDNKVICTSYVSAGKAGLVTEYHNGFVFEVQNDKQYVAYGNDIFSLGKNIQDIVVEYYRDRGLKAGLNKGAKYGHRTSMSNIMKQMLFEKDYYLMSNSVETKILDIKQKYSSIWQTLKVQRDDMIKNVYRTDKITNAQYTKLKSNPEFVKIEQQISELQKQELAEIESIPEYKELKEIDNKYIARLDNVKAKLNGKPMTLDALKEIDKEFASAYETFLDKDDANNRASLLRSTWHNEVLISNPKIIGIFTDNIDKLPTEYLLKAQDENLPIVIFEK